MIGVTTVTDNRNEMCLLGRSEERKMRCMVNAGLTAVSIIMGRFYRNLLSWGRATRCDGFFPGWVLLAKFHLSFGRFPFTYALASCTLSKNANEH